MIRSLGGHGASGNDGLQALWWFWGFSVGGEKGPQLSPLSSCPVSHWAFDCDFWLLGRAEGLPSAWVTGLS